MPFGRVGMDGGMVADTPEIAGWRPGAVPLLRATFTAADGTALTALTNDAGPAWAMPNGGSWAVTSNAAKAGASGANHKDALADLGVADVAFAATVLQGTAGGAAGIVLRANGVQANGYWLVVWTTSGTTLYEFDGASFTSRATGSAPSASTSYRHVASAVGATITYWRDGVQILTFASATRNQAATQHGLHDASTGTPQSTFDNVVAYAAGAVAVPGAVV